MTPAGLGQCGNGARCGRRRRFRVLDRTLFFLAVFLHTHRVLCGQQIAGTVAPRLRFQAGNRTQIQGGQHANCAYVESHGEFERGWWSWCARSGKVSRTFEAGGLHEPLAAYGYRARRVYIWRGMELWAPFGAVGVCAFCIPCCFFAHAESGEYTIVCVFATYLR